MLLFFQRDRAFLTALVLSKRTYKSPILPKPISKEKSYVSLIINFAWLIL
nr:MAG TPA: hypothetical protein [Caudoviricetes sp.]